MHLEILIDNNNDAPSPLMQVTRGEKYWLTGHRYFGFSKSRSECRGSGAAREALRAVTQSHNGTLHETHEQKDLHIQGTAEHDLVIAVQFKKRKGHVRLHSTANFQPHSCAEISCTMQMHKHVHKPYALCQRTPIGALHTFTYNHMHNHMHCAKPLR